MFLSFMNRLQIDLRPRYRNTLEELSLIQDLDLASSCRSSIDFLWVVVQGIKNGKLPLYQKGKKSIINQIFLAYSSEISSNVFGLYFSIQIELSMVISKSVCFKSLTCITAY